MWQSSFARVAAILAGGCALALAAWGQNVIQFTSAILNNPSPQANATFGRSVAPVGDINGDVVPDFLVGANLQDVQVFDQGQVLVFSGADQSLLLTLDHPNPQAGAFLGFAATGIGDVNADGVPDILAGAFGQDVGAANVGQAFVFSGADGSVLHTLNHPNPQGAVAFGGAVAALGDINADGVPDFAISAQGQPVSGNAAQGQAYVFSGATASLLYVLDNPIPQASALFGVALAGISDVSDDGVPDILVGAPSQDVAATLNQGQAFIFSGANGSLLRILDNPNAQANGRFAFSVAGLGDLNSDGISDVAIGASEQDVSGNVDQGQVFIFSGANGALLRMLNHPSPQAGALFGRAVAAVGDVNADRKLDLLVSALAQDVGGNVDQGRVYLFSGADGSLLVTFDDSNPQAGAFFGGSVAAAGDLNRDAAPDFVIGAHRQDVAGNSDQGQAFLFVTALTPQQRVLEFVADVVSLNLRQGISNSLDAKLQAALDALGDRNQNNNAAAINSLQAFINAVEAQRGVHISNTDADALIAAARQIIALLGG